jgi:hypothetical protein
MTSFQKTLLTTAIVLYFSGALFKIMHWPFSNWLHISGILLVMVILLPLLMGSRFNNKPKGKKLYYYLSGFASIYLILSGFLISNLNSKGDLGSICQVSGIVILSLIFLPLAFSLRKESSDFYERKKYKNRIVLVMLYLVVLLLLLIVSVIINVKKLKEIREKNRNNYQVESGSARFRNSKSEIHSDFVVVTNKSSLKL